MAYRTVDRGLSFRHECFRELLQLWEKLRRDRPMPARQDLSPQRLKQHLGWIALIDADADAQRYRYRLIGSNLTQDAKRDATGRYLDELYEPHIWADLAPIFRSIVETKAPVRVHGPRTHVGKAYEHGEALMLPLSNDGERVDMILSRIAIDNV